MAGQATTDFFWKGYKEATQVMAVVYRGTGRMCRQIGITF
jgi:hypothetical protein